MKNFLLKIVHYSISIIIVSFAVQYFVDNGFYNIPNGNYAVWNKILDGEINADIIINGSSRAKHHFNPKILEDRLDVSCFNIGINGGKLMTIKSRWDSYIANNASPKILIQNFDMMYFRNEEYIINKKEFLPYLSENTIFSNLEKIESSVWIDKIIPLYKYRGLHDQICLGLKSYFGKFPEEKNKLYNGYWSDPRSWDQNFVRFKAVNNKIVFLEENIDRSFNYIIELNKKLKKKKIKFILVHTPMYYELQALMPQMDSLKYITKQKAKENDFIFLDYSKHSLSFSKLYFHNSMHLNRNGVNLFNKQLASDLKKYLNTENKSSYAFD